MISTLATNARLQHTFKHILAFMLVFVGAIIALVAPSLAQGFSAERDMMAQDAHLAMQEETLVLIDIRTPEEWAQTGIAQGAHPISMLDQSFITKLDSLQDAHPGKVVAFICASGNRSVFVQEELARRGYQNMFSVFGGTTGSPEALGWIRDGLPIEPWSPN